MTDATGAGAATQQGTAAKAVLVTLAAAQFVMILDSSVMNVSIATVAKDLDTTVTGHPDRDHAVHARHGVADDHRRQDGRDPRSQEGLHDRMRDLRVRIVHDRDLPEPRGADVRLVVPRGCRRRAGDAGDRRAGGVELREGRTTACLRHRDRGRRHRGRAGSAHRRVVHHLLVVALRVRGRGARDRRGAAAQPAHGRHAEGGGRTSRPRRHRALGARARPHRLRRPALGHLGLRATEARRADVAGPVAGDLAAARRGRGAAPLPRVGEAPA